MLNYILNDIFQLLMKAEKIIGNGAKITVFTIYEEMVFQVDWQNDDFHCMKRFKQFEVANADSNLLMDYLCEFAAKAYKNRKNNDA